MSQFKERTALVTGGGRGIGRECCLRLAEQGAKVVVNFRSNEAAADETVRNILDAGGEAIAVGGDVADESQVEHLVERSVRHFGPVELLVNNAGIFDYISHDETTLAVWQRTMDVNLTGLYMVTWAVKDSMIERGFGRIVNLASIAGLRPRPMCIAYAASKAAVVSFTQSTAEAWANMGIRVNAIAPGLVDTEILDGVSIEARQRLIDSTPLQRIGQSSEIADLACFLLSDQSNYITGQTIVADGGRVMLP
ncbi:MAG: 3-oxoacyl-ACP reductase family protein [Pirellulaceae bacterium]